MDRVVGGFYNGLIIYQMRQSYYLFLRTLGLGLGGTMHNSLFISPVYVNNNYWLWS